MFSINKEAEGRIFEDSTIENYYNVVPLPLLQEVWTPFSHSPVTDNIWLPIDLGLAYNSERPIGKKLSICTGEGKICFWTYSLTDQVEEVASQMSKLSQPYLEQQEQH